MDLLDYKIGAQLHLDIFDDSGQIIDKDFVSQFEEAVNGEEAILAIPIIEGVVYAVRVGWTVTVYMQEGNNFYRFYGRITERRVEGNLHVMRVLKTSDIDVAQRRQYYRFACEIPFRYRIVEKPDGKSDASFLQGETADISGSGLRFHTTEALKVGNLIEIILEMERREILVIGRIVRCLLKSEDTEAMVFHYDVGILFSEIEEKDRDLIFKFIFDEERRRIRGTPQQRAAVAAARGARAPVSAAAAGAGAGGGRAVASAGGGRAAGRVLR